MSSILTVKPSSCSWPLSHICWYNQKVIFRLLENLICMHAVTTVNQWQCVLCWSPFSDCFNVCKITLEVESWSYHSTVAVLMDFHNSSSVDAYGCSLGMKRAPKARHWWWYLGGDGGDFKEDLVGGRQVNGGRVLKESWDLLFLVVSRSLSIPVYIMLLKMSQTCRV